MSMCCCACEPMETAQPVGADTCRPSPSLFRLIPPGSAQLCSVPHTRVTDKLMNCHMWITLSQAQTFSIRGSAENYEDNEVVIKMIIKGKKALQ